MTRTQALRMAKANKVRHAPLSQWMEWNGGSCPVGPHVVVEVKKRSTAIIPSQYWIRLAGGEKWDHHSQSEFKDDHEWDEFDIIAYRIIAYRLDETIKLGPVVDVTVALGDDPASPGRRDRL